MKKFSVALISVAMLFSCVSLTAVAEEIKGDINGDGVFSVSKELAGQSKPKLSENSGIEILNSDTVYYYGETPKGYTYCIVKATAEGDATLILDCDSQERYIDFAIDENLNISLKNN